MAIILDGKRVASQVKQELAERVRILHESGINPGLGTVLVGSDPGSVKYVAGKHADCEEIGIASIRRDLPQDATQEQILEVIHELNENSACTGYIVQLPLPHNVDSDAIINAINPAKDADGMHPYNLGELVLKTRGTLHTPLPCTPRGVIELLRAYNIDLEGKHIVVLGRGITIGRTIGLLLTRADVNATVTLCHTGTKNIEEHIQSADIVIAAVGKAGFIKPQYVRSNAILVDVGVSRIYDEHLGRFRIHGDVDHACYERVAAYTPNPGGVGPMTRAMLLENVVDMAQRSAGLL